MLENVNYNLMETITIISRSLHRYETYAKDASDSDCRSCKEIWRKIAERREMELKMLLRELKDHLDGGKLSLQ
jgi:rubrerythrin